jgi:hypothetical protein
MGGFDYYDHFFRHVVVAHVFTLSGSEITEITDAPFVS